MLAQTGASKVDLVGHSQGGMMPRYYLKNIDASKELNAGDETPGSVDYTNIATRYDEVVTPYTSAFLAADGNQVTNVTLQDDCPNDTSEHLRTPYDPPSIQIPLNALGRSGPADPSFRPACVTL